MSLNSVKFVCTALANSNKEGVLPADGHGYREVVLGGLNMFNSAGEYYVYEQAKEIFESSSQLMRRVKRGALRGEYGHPKFTPGMSNEQFAQRVLSIHEDMVSHHISEVYLDFNRVKDDRGRPVIAIIGKVAPAGKYGDALERSFNNPNENVCFSIRAFTDDQRIGGVNHRVLRSVVTWDYVNEPGLSVAEKFKSPSLESMQELVMSRGVIERGMAAAQRSGIATECAVLTAGELFTSMGWRNPHQNSSGRPSWANW